MDAEKIFQMRVPKKASDAFAGDVQKRADEMIQDLVRMSAERRSPTTDLMIRRLEASRDMLLNEYKALHGGVE
ncbi:hypothetical protein K2X33_04915, partial [bacterium]|nr:hypothetical protein [bacterium]